MKHDRPIDSVGRHKDILADNMGSAGPKFAKIRQARVLIGEVAGKGDIVQEGIEPDISDVVRIKRELDTPGQPLRGPGNAQIPGEPLNRIDEFGPPKVRDYEVRASLDKILKPLFMLREREIPVFLLEEYDLAPFWSKVSR